MEHGTGLTNGHVESEEHATSGPESTPNAVAVQVAAADDDAMDTSPDAETAVVLPNGSADPQEANDNAPTSPVPNGDTQVEQGSNEQAPPVPSADDAVNPSHPSHESKAANSIQTQTETAAPVDSTLPTDPESQPPPPPPPVEPIRSDVDSSDDDDGVQPWQPIQEDTSSPDEAELKEIDEANEHSALDHEYWESKAYPSLEEPEYTAGVSGRIDWVIDAYNGTREKPNRDIVMKSEPVTIGGHQWQIKFYPKGNDTDYLSVYLDCLSVVEPKKEPPVEPKIEEASKESTEGEAKDGAKEESMDEVKDENKQEDPISAEAKQEAEPGAGAEVKEEDIMVTSDDAPNDPPSDLPVIPQHAPLPLLGSKVVPKRKSVAAQISVVVYNPAEPRVNFSKTAVHRFCNASPDWGWTRFHGPIYDIPQRIRGQRQALLRDDKLSFHAYVRIIEDETNCLWEHHDREHAWDSFAMTGLQSLVLGESANAPGGNFISAIASWILFKPFRHLLYSINVADPDEHPFTRPKPLISAFQKVLYMLRTHVDPGAGAVTLDDILDALEWYGIHERLDKLDVMEVWEVLRAKLEEELHDTSCPSTLQALFGPKRNYSIGEPSYRVPVLGVETMQDAVNKSSGFALSDQPLPELLTIELERQDFDLKTRSYVKVMNKISLDDRITVANTSYTLYGFVVHKQTLQSYVYQPVLRPEGPGSRWYSYSDSKDDNRVKCLPKQQALDGYQGKTSVEQVIGNDSVAYIAMYIRDDKAQSAFLSDAESDQWDVPEWIKNGVQRSRMSSFPPPMPPIPVEETTAKDDEQVKEAEEKPVDTEKMLDFQVIESRAFTQHEGPGLFNAYDSEWEQKNSDLIHKVQLSSKDGCKEIREQLTGLLNNIQDPRQIKFWFLDPVRGAFNRPCLLGTGKIEFSSGSFDRYTNSKGWTLEESPFACRRIWVHVIDFDKLPEPPKEPEVKEEEMTEAAQEISAQEVPASEVPASVVLASEVPASEAPAPVVAEAETTTTEPSAENLFEVLPHSEDTPMSEPDEQPAVQAEPSSELTIDPPSEAIAEVSTQPPAELSTEVLVPEVEPSIPPVAENADTNMVEVEAAVMPDPPAVDVVIPNTTTSGDTEMGGTQEDMPPPPPPPAPVDIPEAPAEIIQPPPPARTPSPEPPPDEIYFFLKLWNPEKQVLEPKGSHIALKSIRVDETVVTLLGLPIEDKKKIEMCEEEELNTTRFLKHRRTFAQLDLHNTAIIIAALPQTAEQRSALAASALFADPQPYLAYRAFVRNFPQQLNGHFTYTYFSRQHYKGEIKNGHRHGHGTRIYHSGATYSGTFRLSQRHGHGLYTFQNGDTYDGDWVDNQQHGSGTFVEASTGNTYVGGWKQDKKFGEGVTHWKNAQEAERLCRICWDGEAEAAFYDCGHVVACLGCAREVQNCPVCRKRVLSAMRLYYVA